MDNVADRRHCTNGAFVADRAQHRHYILGGAEVRIHLSNRFGTVPLTVGRVTIGLQASGASLRTWRT